MNKREMTIPEAARVTGYNAEYLRQRIRRGDVKGRKVLGAVWLVDRASLARYIRNRGNKPGAKL